MSRNSLQIKEFLPFLLFLIAVHFFHRKQHAVGEVLDVLSALGHLHKSVQHETP